MLFMHLFSLLFIGSLTLTACGFHLRGSYYIPPELAQLSLKIEPYSALNQPLRQRLQQAGIELSINEYTLEIRSDSLNRQMTNTDSRAKAAEYTLYYQVSYVIKNSQNKVVFDERKLLLRRSYQYDTTSIVGKTAEEETLVKELYEDAATQIVSQLSSFRPASNTP